MKNPNKKSPDKEPPEIKKFLLHNSVALRNEIDYMNLDKMVHPLTFTYDLKKHPHMNAIPVLDKYESKELKDLFFEVFE